MLIKKSSISLHQLYQHPFKATTTIKLKLKLNNYAWPTKYIS